MRSFADIQAAFQRGILEGDDTILAELVDSPREQRDRLFRVYRDAYVLRLVEVLGNDYERLKALLGTEAFATLARAFVAANPSRNPNARWFGQRLPEFLAAQEPFRSDAILADLAAIERNLNDVFDAADGDRLAIEHLGVLAPEDWPGVVFSPHPSTRRATLTTNALDIWRALGDDQPAPASEVRDEPLRLAFYRPAHVSMLRPMSYEEAMMWDEMAKGVPFGILCELVATYGGEEDAPLRAAQHLKTWIEAGMLAGPEADESADAAL